MLPILSGVPRGSIFGPLLFLVYINDLPLAITFLKLLLFGDDGKCALPISISSDNLKLQHDIHSLNKWSKTWNLHFNSEKFTLLHFFSTLTSTYTIASVSRGLKTSHKVFISNDLKWNVHYDFILSKAYSLTECFTSTKNL